MQESLLFKLEKYTQNYINEKKSLNYSINTINTYTLILESYYEYMVKYEDKIDLEDITKDILLEYINSNNKLSNSSKQLRLTVIKSLFKYIDQNDDKYNFEKEFKKLNIKIQRKEIESLSDDEVQRLLKLFTKKSNSFNFNRDKLLINILLFTGIRATELLNLKYTDIELIEDDTMYRLLITGKGNKQRYEYIVKDKIDNELIFLKDYFTDDTLPYIAITNKNKHMSRIGLYNVISNKLKKANIPKKGVHILRHTFAKNLVAKNVNLSTIKDLLGHENISTTMVYAKSNECNKIGAVRLL